MIKQSPAQLLDVCIFRLADKIFALRLESVGEILPMAALSRPPSMPSILEGILNLEGVGIPVLRLAALLELAPSPLDSYTPLLVLRGRPPLALLVDGVVGISSLPGDALARLAAADSFNGCVDGDITVDGMLVHVLSLDRLLLAQERQRIVEFQERETERLVSCIS